MSRRRVVVDLPPCYNARVVFIANQAFGLILHRPPRRSMMRA
jgi:hypothetical protein